MDPEMLYEESIPIEKIIMLGSDLGEKRRV